MGWTTTDLLADIRLIGRLSSNDTDYTDANLLLEADFQIRERFTPAVVSVREEYYERIEDFTITADQQPYAFPQRAFASVLREVAYIGTSTTNHRILERVPIGLRHEWAASKNSQPIGYCVIDDKIYLLGTPNVTTGTLRVTYEYRPGKLILPAAAMEISESNFTTGVLSGASPAAWDGDEQFWFDIIKATPPFALVNADLANSAITTGTSITFTAADLDSTRIADDTNYPVGDFVALTGESPVPQIPAFMHPTLARAVAASVLGETGDQQGMAYHEARVAEALAKSINAMSPRQKGNVQKIVNRNSHLRSRNRRGHAGISDGEP